MTDKNAQLPGEPLLDYIARIGTGEYVKRLSQEKVANKLKSDERKSGQGYFKFKKGKAIKVNKQKFDDDIYEEDRHPEYEGDPVMPMGPFKKKKIMSVEQGGFAPNTEYTGSFIDGTFDDLNVSNKSYLKYYKDLLK
jgi:hypothetical protein